MVVAREQRRTRRAAVRLSTIDALTGLANRAYLIAAIEREIERGTRYGRGFCLLMADLDNLKEVNDSFGHSAGDRVLAGVADVIRAGVRRIDTAARLGGDEFVVLLPETDPAGAFVAAEKIRQGVEAMPTIERHEHVPVSVSIGLVAWPDDGATLEQLMDAVDEAMYAAKQRGKNRIGGPYARAGAMTPVILPGRADRRSVRAAMHERMGERAEAAGPAGDAVGRPCRCTIRRWRTASRRARSGRPRGSRGWTSRPRRSPSTRPPRSRAPMRTSLAR